MKHRKTEQNYLIFLIPGMLLLVLLSGRFLIKKSFFKEIDTSQQTNVVERSDGLLQKNHDTNMGKSEQIVKKKISWNPDWKFSEYATLIDDEAILYQNVSPHEKTILVNAGHGTPEGTRVKNYCHPDRSPKVTGGSTQEGETKAYAVAYGCVLQDGTEEQQATLELAIRLRDELLKRGYHVIMVREEEHSQTGFDNIARTVIGNENADVHIALHYDSTDTDKGAFFADVPNDETYLSMDPVRQVYQEHHRLGVSVIQKLKEAGVPIFGDGTQEIDLTQTSFSTIPSCVLEVGDTVSDRSEKHLNVLAQAIADGIDQYFQP